MKKFSRKITADDFEVGTKMMVSRSRRKNMAEGQVGIELMIQGAVIEIRAFNLPYILVSASCPMRGQTDLVLDIRDHEFIRVSAEFAEAVFAAAQPEQEETSNNEIRF